jgi:two-component system CheB/CheR fusion protein
VQERDVRDRQGRWYSLRIRPYKNVDNRIDGAVLTLFDIDVDKRHEAEIRQARATAQAVVETVSTPVVLLDRDFRLQFANPAFCSTHGLRSHDIEGRSLFELAGGAWDVPALRDSLQTHADHPVKGEFELMLALPQIGERRLRVGARRIEGATHDASSILLVIEDATAAGEAE